MLTLFPSGQERDLGTACVLAPNTASYRILTPSLPRRFLCCLVSETFSLRDQRQTEDSRSAAEKQWLYGPLVMRPAKPSGNSLTDAQDPETGPHCKLPRPPGERGKGHSVDQHEERVWLMSRKHRGTHTWPSDGREMDSSAGQSWTRGGAPLTGLTSAGRFSR